MEFNGTFLCDPVKRLNKQIDQHNKLLKVMNGNCFEVKELTILPCSTCAGSKVQGGGRTVPSIPTPHKNLGRKPVPNQSAQNIIKPFDVLK